MRKLLVFTVLIVLTACSGDDRGTTQTAPVTPNTTTTSTSAPTTIVDVPTISTTTTVASDESRDPGTESVGVTDKVTIIILDPED